MLDTSFSDLCRSCDSTYFVCSVSVICPIDFYKHDGICKRCSIGCGECSDFDTCTACDSSLVLTTLTNSTVTCKCGSGFYGVEDSSTDTLNCLACTGTCTECDGTSTTCTGCSTPNFLLGNTCTTTCGTTKFGDATDRVCKD